MCRMGRKAESFEQWNAVFLVARNDFDAAGFMRTHGLILAEKRDVGLSFTDRLQFAYFTPLPNFKRRYSLFEFHRASAKKDMVESDDPVEKIR
jgi:hypothetical protein